MDRVEYDEFMEEQYGSLEERSKFVPLDEARRGVSRAMRSTVWRA